MDFWVSPMAATKKPRAATPTPPQAIALATLHPVAGAPATKSTGADIQRYNKEHATMNGVRDSLLEGALFSTRSRKSRNLGMQISR
mmetsp:Transcript_84950/g.265784  ORF Transcript_84950/g.265784 Transcript_84950/m.265784 type:complete len:86 (-) Transcript_84950:376-633(-)